VPERVLLSDRLETCVEVMTTLALPFPSSFTADAQRAELAVVLPEGPLTERSTGPYSPERIPAEHERMIDRIDLRWHGRFERPDLTVAVGGDWPELVMVLPVSQVFVRLLMPEAGRAGAASPWSLGLTMDVKAALGWVAGVLRLAGDPAAVVDVSYAADPEADRRRAQLPPEFQAASPPVVGTVGVDLRACRPQQLQAFLAAVRAIVDSTDQQIEVGSWGFTTRLGFAAVHARY
jgi:hypothetical protein